MFSLLALFQLYVLNVRMYSKIVLVFFELYFVGCLFVDS